MIRLPGICNFDPETTVLAHYRLSGYSGMGIKSDDQAFGAWACSACHDAVDGRTMTAIPRDKLLRYHAEGVMRTNAERNKCKLTS